MRLNPGFLVPLTVLLCGPALFAEGAEDFPYALNPVKDTAWIAGDLALFGGSLYFNGTKTTSDSPNLDKSKIPFFDGLYTDKQSAALGTTADVLVVAFAALPAIALPGLDAKQIFTVGAMYAESIGLAYSLSGFIQSLVVRYRPYAYSSPPPSDIGSTDINSSFPSRHSTLAFTTAVFAATVFDELHPDSPYRPWLWAGGLGVATAIAGIRVASGDHFVSDVVAGAALGALIGYAVPKLHEVNLSRRGPDGSGTSLDLSPAGLFIDIKEAR
jgi:membrane-associated phospholipid phosphatase